MDTLDMMHSVPMLLELMRQRVAANINVKRQILADGNLQRTILDVAMAIVKSLRGRGKVLFFGNGGSAADAQHLAAEFTGRYLCERRPLPALALNANTSAITAIGNDYGFELVFARQMEALGQSGDVCIGISTSGNSPNILRALELAKSKSIVTVAMTGACGGIASKIADYAICAPSSETPRIQECHILVGHIVCEIVERAFCNESERDTETLAQSEVEKFAEGAF